VTSLRGLGGALRMHLRLYATHFYHSWQIVILPAAMAALAVLVLRSRGSTGYFHVLMGAGLIGMWTALVGTSSFTMLRERLWFGTFELLTGFPVRLPVIYAGYLLAEALVALVAVPVSFGVGLLLLGPHLAPPPLPTLASVVVAELALTSMAMLLAALVLLAPSLLNWQHGFQYPVWIVCGFLFPVTLLPGWAGAIGAALPASWAGQALDASAAGAPAAAVLSLWGPAVALSAVYVLAALLLFQVVGDRFRREGVPA
jgi:ABC-2 type transport system permease protein